jgi:hypothetical protein
VAAATLALGLGAATAWGAAYTYTGLGTNPSNWSDPANWSPSTGFPSGTGDDVLIPSGTGAISFINTPSQLRHFTTGDGSITMPSTLTIYRSSGITGHVNIGTGGITFTAGGLLSDSNGGKVFTSAGTIVSPALHFYDAQPVQSGGHWDVRNLGLGSGGATASPLLVQSWDIRNAAGMRIGQFGLSGAHDDQNVTFMATPNITGGRPNWDFTNTSGDGGNNSVINLNGFTLYGDRLRLDGRRATYGGSILRNTVAGGTLDLNSVQIALGNQAGARDAYLDLANTTVLIQGTGTVWENDSTNNTRFSITANTTVTFNPNGASAGTASIDTGSTDAGAGGFANNFAFGNVVIGAGDTITLIGNDNTASPANNALYVNGTLSGAGTINANGRNVYVGGTLAPGSSIGTLAVTNATGSNGVDLSLATLAIEFGTGGADRLDVSGGRLTLGGSSILSFTDLGTLLADPINGDTFTIATYGTLSGTFDSVTGPANFLYDVQYGGGLITVTIIPEPGTLALLALAGLAALRRRR